MTLSKRTLIALAAAVTMLAVALAVFEPWRLFTSTTVHEALPPTSGERASPSGGAGPLTVAFHPPVSVGLDLPTPGVEGEVP